MPGRGNTVLDLQNPGPMWEVHRDPGRLQPGTMYGVLAGHREEDAELTPVDFRPKRLEESAPGQVVWKGGRVISETRFGQLDPCFNN